MPGERYVALSYSWGKPAKADDKFLVTTALSLAHHKESIAISKCPQTIRDATETTRSIGFKYLWVDSLCILQGSDDLASEDFEEQCKTMGEIYHRAFVTIVAANTLSAEEGFLRKRFVGEERWISLHRSVYGAGQRPDYQNSEAKVAYLASQSPLDDVSTADWRCWCLQETLLSKRLLLFYDQTVILVCSRGRYTEPKGFIYRHMATKFRDIFFDVPPWREVFASGTSIILDIREETRLSSCSKKRFKNDLWTDIVCNFTKRAITEPMDKIPAITGVSEIWRRTFQDKFCAGMWVSDLPTQLLWSHKGHWTPGGWSFAFEEFPVAPSWSWLNVRGEVNFHPGFCGYDASWTRMPHHARFKSEEYSQIEDCVYSERPNLPARTVRGYLVVRGRLARLEDLPNQRIASSDPDLYPSNNFMDWRGLYFDEPYLNNTEEYLYYMELVRYRYLDGTVNSSWTNCSSGLILRKANASYPSSTSGELQSGASTAYPQVAREHSELPRLTRVGVLWAANVENSKLGNPTRAILQ